MDNIKLSMQNDKNYPVTSRNIPDNIQKDEKEEKIEFEQIHEALVESFNRKKYRKIFEFLDKREKFYKQANLDCQLFFSHMKMNCIMKIIDKKFNKYYRSIQIKGIEKWFKFANTLLNEFDDLIYKLKSYEIKEQCEYIILYNIKINYYHALYSKHKKDNKDYICYLIMAEQVIKNVIDKVTFPEIFIYAIRVYLLMSNLLIQDHSFFSAINYLLAVLQICKISKNNESELKIKKDKQINNIIFSSNRENEINNEQMNFDHFITEINFLSAIAFCLLGACFENLNEISLSNSVYRQAKWFSDHLLTEKEFHNLSKLSHELAEKSTKERNIINILSRLDIEKFINEHKKKEEKKIYDSFLNKKMIKYKKIEKNIENLKIKESEQLQEILLNDDNNKENKHKSKNIKLMTNNVILLNYLTSKEFKPVIYNIKNINLYNMNRETEMLITKKLENIKDKNKKSLNSPIQINKTKESINDTDSNSYFGYKKFRNNNRFKTELSCKNLGLISKEKNNPNNFNPIKNNEKSQGKFGNRLSSKNIVSRNFVINLSDNIINKSNIRKGSDNSYPITKKFSLNNSYFLDEISINKSKGYNFKKSISSKISSEISENSLHVNKNFESSTIKNKIIFNKKNDIKKKENRKNKVPKPRRNNSKMDKFIFNKIYSKKLAYLDNLTNKEYKFQKSILRNKSYEKMADAKYDPDKDKKNAEFFYIKTLEEKLKLLEEKVQTLNKIDTIDYNKEKEYERKLILYQNKACTTLNYKDTENYYKLLRNINSADKEIKKKKKKSKFNFSLTKINENNNMQMNILGGKIEKIEKKIAKSLSKIKSRKITEKNKFPKIQKINKNDINGNLIKLKKMDILIEEFPSTYNTLSLNLDPLMNDIPRKNVNFKSNLISEKNN